MEELCKKGTSLKMLLRSDGLLGAVQKKELQAMLKTLRNAEI